VRWWSATGRVRTHYCVCARVSSKFILGKYLQAHTYRDCLWNVHAILFDCCNSKLDYFRLKHNHPVVSTGTLCSRRLWICQTHNFNFCTFPPIIYTYDYDLYFLFGISYSRRLEHFECLFLICNMTPRGFSLPRMLSTSLR
jgi:hypothetical protein